MRVRDYKMHGATPTGRSRTYTYYTTTRKIKKMRLRVPTTVVEEQMVDLLRGIRVDPRTLPQLQGLYRRHTEDLKGPNTKEQIAELQDRSERLHVEEAALARLYAQGKLTDKNYDVLYREWQEKVFETQQEIARLETSTDEVLDDLDHALLLLAYAPELFDRLETLDQRRLLQILFRRIIIDTQGKVVDFDLNPPFIYLSSLTGASSDSPTGRRFTKEKQAGSNQFQSALSNRNHLELSIEAEKYIETVSFPHRNMLDGLLHQIGEDIRDGSFAFTD